MGSSVAALVIGLVGFSVVPEFGVDVYEPHIGTVCEAGGLWHFVHNQIPSGTSAGELTATFSVTGEVTVTANKVLNSTQHYDVIAAGQLLSASDNIDEGRLVLSHVDCDESTTTTAETTTTSEPDTTTSSSIVDTTSTTKSDTTTTTKSDTTTTTATDTTTSSSIIDTTSTTKPDSTTTTRPPRPTSTTKPEGTTTTAPHKGDFKTTWDLADNPTTGMKA